MSVGPASVRARKWGHVSGVTRKWGHVLTYDFSLTFRDLRKWGHVLTYDFSLTFRADFAHPRCLKVISQDVTPRSRGRPPIVRCPSAAANSTGRNPLWTQNGPPLPSPLLPRREERGKPSAL